MNNADKSILDKVKTDLFQILFNHNSAYYPDLEWHHQLGKDKNVSECGNLRETFMEIKKYMCVPIPRTYHELLHGYNRAPFSINIFYPSGLLNSIAKDNILAAYGISARVPPNTQISYGTKTDGCAYEFAKGGNASSNYCSKIGSPYITTTTTWDELFLVLGI